MPSPGASTATINDLIPKVKAALQNRQDVSENNPNLEMRPSAWIRDALREITDSTPFEELRQPNPPLVTIGPLLGTGATTSQKTYQYPVSLFLNPNDDVTLMEDPVIFIDPPRNTISYPMDYMTPKAIATLLNVPGGTPYYYTRYGSMFWFGTQPGQGYTVYLPYQLRHQFEATNLPVSPVYVPSSWFDIVAYAAAERGAIALRWNEQSDFLHRKLYGDPASQMKDGTLARPGLIAARVLQQERDRRLSTIQVMPMVQRY